ncbi:MAG TPA: hypothetical protein VGM30_14065 [Puia sp.]
MIDNPAALEQRLATFAPITIKPNDPFYKKYGVFLIILGFGSMVAVYTVTNKIIVGICGVLVTGLLIWAFYEIRTSKNLPGNTKRSGWAILILIASTIYITYSKLMGTL